LLVAPEHKRVVEQRASWVMNTELLMAQLKHEIA
jgi:hypothetical protein